MQDLYQCFFWSSIVVFLCVMGGLGESIVHFLTIVEAFVGLDLAGFLGDIFL